MPALGYDPLASVIEIRVTPLPSISRVADTGMRRYIGRRGALRVTLFAEGTAGGLPRSAIWCCVTQMPEPASLFVVGVAKLQSNHLRRGLLPCWVDCQASPNHGAT